MPFVISSQRDMDQHLHSPRQSHSPSDYQPHGHRQHQQNSGNTRHSTKQRAAGVPLHQPSSGLQTQQDQQQPPATLASGGGHLSAQSRPYNPLSASSCSGEHSHYKMCNTNVRADCFCWSCLIISEVFLPETRKKKTWNSL